MLFDPYAYDLKRSTRLLAQPTDLLAADALLAVPLEAQETLWRGLRAVIEDALDFYERTPPGVTRQPPVFALRHTGQLYGELKRRAGKAIALTVLRGELRLLRHRNSPVAGPLVYD